MAETTVVFQASDLNQRGRAILDVARKGEARVRDKDGLSLLIVPEHRFLAIVAATANLMAIEQMLDVESGRRSLRDYADWTWLRTFDDEDLHEFVHDMRTALLIAGREESVTLVQETLDRWHMTARQIDDPLRRSILLGQETLAPDDFVDVIRPA